MERLYKEVVSIRSLPHQLPSAEKDSSFLRYIQQSIHKAAEIGETSVPVFVHKPYQHLLHTSLPQTLAPFKLVETSSPYYIHVTWQKENARSLTSTTVN